MNNRQLQEAINATQNFISTHVDTKNWNPGALELARNHLRNLYIIQERRAEIMTAPLGILENKTNAN